MFKSLIHPNIDTNYDDGGDFSSGKFYCSSECRNC